MSSDWKKVPIGDICEGIFDGPHATPKKTDSGPVFLGISSLDNGRLNLDKVERLSEEDFINWTKRITPRGGDIVFSYETRLGEVAMIPERLRCCLGRRMALMRVDCTKAVPKYVLYAYMAPNFQETIRARTIHGSTVDRIPLKEFGSFPISLPSLAVQEEIVKVLSALDDRISILRKTNKTLESIAQTIFKSWFVDFDPVRAKTEGRLPEGMDEETAKLFPDEFEESELGLIPKGWDLTPFGKLLDINIGGDWGAELPDNQNDQQVAIVRGTDIPNLQMGSMKTIPYRFTTSKKLSSRKLEIGDIVIEVSGGSRNQPTGRSLYFTQNLLEQFTCPVEPASFCRLFRPISRSIGLLLAQHLSYIYSEGKTWQYQNQSTGISNFQTKHFLETERIPMPSTMVLQKFADIVQPIMMRCQQTEIRNIEELRDVLLPRLISGKLRINSITPAS